jgi:peptide/nickel transport system permease protein
MRFLRPTLSRAAELGAVLMGVSALVLLLLRLAPGDPWSVMQSDPRVTAAARAAWAPTFSPSQSWASQWLAFWHQLLGGHLGWSFSQQRAIADVLGDALPWSLLLMGGSLMLSAGGGALLGGWLAYRDGTARARWTLRALRALAAVPDAWLALVLLSLLAVTWPLFPMQGVCDPRTCASAGSGTLVAWRDAPDVLRHAVLPVLTLTLLQLTRFARVQRSAMLPALASPVARAATARGVPARVVLWRYVARRTVLAWVAMVGMSLPSLVGGAVFVERVFGWPGAGQVLLHAIGARDYPLVLIMAMLAGSLTVLGAWSADLVAAWLDPRERHA